MQEYFIFKLPTIDGKKYYFYVNENSFFYYGTSLENFNWGYTNIFK